MIKILVLLSSLPALIFCWWDVGHMLTAAIAEIRLNQLDPSHAHNILAYFLLFCFYSHFLSTSLKWYKLNQ